MQQAPKGVAPGRIGADRRSHVSTLAAVSHAMASDSEGGLEGVDRTEATTVHQGQAARARNGWYYACLIKTKGGFLLLLALALTASAPMRQPFPLVLGE